MPRIRPLRSPPRSPGRLPLSRAILPAATVGALKGRINRQPAGVQAGVTGANPSCRQLLLDLAGSPAAPADAVRVALVLDRVADERCQRFPGGGYTLASHAPVDQHEV